MHFPSAGSLKAKRQLLKSLKDRVRNKFNVSVAEIDGQDLWQRGTLGIAIIATDKAFANSVLSKVSDLVNTQPEIVITDIRMEWL